MPELPDLEYLKFYFENNAIDKTIQNITCEAPELIQDISFEKFKKQLTGTQFNNPKRRGKFLVIEISNRNLTLALHFAMTGSLHYTKQGAEKVGDDRFTRLAFQFENGYEMRWLNMRKLGKIYLVQALEDIDLIENMGPEPLDLSLKEFEHELDKHSNKMLKSFLMDQNDIAGIGNVYSDEILFHSKLHPRKKIKSLNTPEKENLYTNMRQILQRGSEIRINNQRFHKDKWIIPHRNEDMQCPANEEHKLISKKVSGRTAIFCPECQKT